ncbi:MAG: glycogen synthase GlgA [Actinomycetia bacterium]|nr:glycogen synthase GlgA [Actinomycetes bacterium]
MNVLFVTSECYPLVKTGGLADVTGALPLALAALAVDARVLLPAYPGVREQLASSKNGATIADLFGGEATLVDGTTATGLKVTLIDAPHLYDRTGGGIYAGPNGHDWPDNHLRFAALSWVAAEIAGGRLGKWRPDVVHVHDWHAALTAAYIQFDTHKKRLRATRAATLLTIHNLAFQGLFPESTLAELRLPDEALEQGGIAYWGKLSFLKAGVRWCDAVSTVSPTYAREIVTPEHGMGFDSALKDRAEPIVGIANGIDLAVWNPATDSNIVATYSKPTSAAKAPNKVALQAELGLEPDANAPLFCVVSRLTEQKGLDLLLAALPHLLARGAQLAVLGTGDRKLEKGFRRAAKKHPGRVAAVIDYNEAMSHRMQAGADAIIVPSRFEPCGLTQLYGLRYGTLPVVAKVGGLADTVDDGLTGFQFEPVDQDQLTAAIDTACDAFATPVVWQRMMRAAMKQDVGWGSAAREYRALYERLLQARR